MIYSKRGVQTSHCYTQRQTHKNDQNIDYSSSASVLSDKFLRTQKNYKVNEYRSADRHQFR